MPIKSLLKALTEAGIGSRRRMADAIKQGRVEVNGELAESFNHPVNAGKDSVSVNGQPVNIRPDEIICLMLNKPDNIVSTISDEKGRHTVLDILPPKYRKIRLYPVGRLDKDTTGLLLLTNDGDLTYRLTHPRFEHEKEYLVHIRGSLKQDEIKKLEHGILLEDGMTYPASVKADASSPPFNYSITIHEGRKRQVRRMFERLRHPVLALKRIRIGRLSLGSLKEGEVRRLNPQEIKLLLDN
jgi:23S rRNA pseudouridine2605 synthase